MIPFMPENSPWPAAAAVAEQAATALDKRVVALEAENARLLALLRSRDDFLTQAAHELRNPMTPMLGQIQLLRRQVGSSLLPPEGVDAGLGRLEWIISRYIRRATSLLDVTRLQAGRLRFAAEDPDAARTQYMQEYEDTFATPYIAADRGFVDAVIEPNQTRREVAKALRLLRTKRETLPPKKHGNIPL